MSSEVGDVDARVMLLRRRRLAFESHPRRRISKRIAVHLHVAAIECCTRLATLWWALRKQVVAPARELQQVGGRLARGRGLGARSVRSLKAAPAHDHERREKNDRAEDHHDFHGHIGRSGRRRALGVE